MSISAEMRAKIEGWTKQWESTDSLDDVDYVARAGIGVTTPPIRVGGTDVDPDNSVYLAVGCGMPTEDGGGPCTDLALASYPDGAEMSASLVRQGEVVEFNG